MSMSWYLCSTTFGKSGGSFLGILRRRDSGRKSSPQFSLADILQFCLLPSNARPLVPIASHSLTRQGPSRPILAHRPPLDIHYLVLPSLYNGGRTQWSLSYIGAPSELLQYSRATSLTLEICGCYPCAKADSAYMIHNGTQLTTHDTCAFRGRSTYSGATHTASNRPAFQARRCLTGFDISARQYLPGTLPACRFFLPDDRH